ncbi:MAG: hypothetical protein KDC57_03180, partial [Saprospiraceae bacterium]|nr:hypothetical protein [Saprospiraceae bacterium]
MKNSLLLLTLLLLLGVQFAYGQVKKTSAPSTADPMYEPSLYNGMEWRLVGPYRGGRAGTVTGVPGHPNLF